MPLPPWPTVPNPSTWSPGPILVPNLRNDVSNAVSLLSNRPSFLANCTTGPSVPSGGSGQTVTLDSEQYDNWQGHDPLGSEPGWYYCRLPGWYIAEGYVSWSYNTATTVSFLTQLTAGTSGGSLITYPGEQHPVNDTRTPGVMTADLFKLTNVWAPGTTLPASGVDYIALNAKQNSGSAQNLVSLAVQTPWLGVRWVAAASGTTGLPVPSNPAWPVPPAYITSAGYLNPAIRDTIRFLAYPPIFRGVYSAGVASLASQSFPAGSALGADTITVDNYSGWNASSKVYVAPVAGVYYACAQVSTGVAAAVGQYAAGFQINGGTIIWGKAVRAPAASTGTIVAAVKRLRLSAGDQVSLAGMQSSGSSLTVLGGSPAQTKLILVWESS